MPVSSPALAPPNTAVLLVLLPLEAGAAPPTTLAWLNALQQQLRPAIRVLKIDEASHPVVVRSFRAAELPACVLVRQGIELWRQHGLPVGEHWAPLLLSKLTPEVRP
ncbi:thioredoxin [Hymenobacter sp. HSC-4F20]|uniref:thioredoxin n=1 Tax=Hymenobacter sp. HSC-4F20 TaxID=2864135 RepID=UPI001C735CF7|nr:thioredoxin [Hymenobacter sp. HSC-4F20]MBX0293070.1 thioredoxin [Hymenobacter sp. HSC-4F20]